jgi:hypothetical protein
MNIKFVKIDERFLSWEEKDNKLTGYRVSNASDVYSVNENMPFATKSTTNTILSPSSLSPVRHPPFVKISKLL